MVNGISFSMKTRDPSPAPAGFDAPKVLTAVQAQTAAALDEETFVCKFPRIRRTKRREQ